jgi:hypothetical protein
MTEAKTAVRRCYESLSTGDATLVDEVLTLPRDEDIPLPRDQRVRA